VTLLKNRKTAILITAIVAILATLLGVRGSLNRLARDVEAMFVSGVYLEDEKFTQPGIYAHLENRAASALALATALESYPELKAETENLLTARRGLMNANTIKDRYAANESLQQAFTALEEKAGKLSLSGRDKETLEMHASDFSGARTAIMDSRYNAAAASYLDGVSILARILRPFVFVKPPQAFA